jgi:hypothetical protein
VTLENVIPFVIVAIIVIGAIGKQLRGLGRGYNALVEQQRGAALRAAQPSGPPASAGAAAQDSDIAAVRKAVGAAYQAAPAYSAAVSATPPAYQPARAAAVKRAAPVARSVDVPAAAFPAAVAPVEHWSVADAFRNPANARTAIIMAEILGPPRALR